MYGRKFGVILLACVAAAAVALFAGGANADIVGTYVDADLTNTGPSAEFSTTESDTDGLWHLDTSRSYGGNGNVIVAQTSDEHVDPLTTTISGLANGTYNVYAVYWRHSSDFWAIDAKVAGGSIVVCDSEGTATGTTGDSDKAQYYKLLGQAVVTDGSFSVEVSEHAGANRAWYDGIAYEAAVPEPGTMALLATALLGLLAYAWRKRK